MASCSKRGRLAPQKEAAVEALKASDLFSEFEDFEKFGRFEIDMLGEALLHDDSVQHHALDLDVCVWPPVLVGKRDHNLPLEEGELQGDLCLRMCIKNKLQREESSRGIGVDSLYCCKDVNKNRPLFVFSSTSGNGYLAARHMERVWSNLQDAEVKQFRNAGWTLKYATVGDMVEIDPHRKVVDWIPLCSSVEHDLKTGDSFKEVSNGEESGVQVNLNKKVFKQSLSPLLKTGGVSERLRDLLRAKHASMRSHGTEDLKQFSDELEEMIQEGFTKPTQNFLAETNEKESLLREVFASDDLQVGKALSQRFNSLAEIIRVRGSEVRVNAGKTFTSKMVNEGVELELGIFRLMASEIRNGKKYDEKLRKAKEDRVASARKVVKKLKMEMMELLMKSSTESKSILEAKLFSQLKMVKSIRRSKEEVFALTKFLSTGTTGIAEQVHKDALKERDLYHAQKREMQEQKLVSANEEVIVNKNKVAILSANLKELREANLSNQECCICYNKLEGFLLSSGHGESSSSKKRHKRACFLPCMHANVCATCSENRWSEGPQLCPICCQTLTEKPRVIYL